MTIGSGQFIPGFEDGLIGVAVGETIDLNLTFPDPYPNNPDLAGEDVVFTVTVNSLKSMIAATTATAAKEMGFATEIEYLNDVRIRSIKNYLFTEISSASKIKDYPQDDIDYLLTELKESSGVTSDEQFEQMLNSYYGYTKDEFIDEMLKPQLKDMMLVYAVLDEAELEVTQSDIDTEANEIAAELNDGTTAGEVKDQYGSYYIEYLVVSEKVLDYMYEKADIK